jgi:uncharacterized membrane protein YccC
VLGCVWAGYAVFRINYAAFSICITAYVVFLFGLAGMDQRDVVSARIVDTAVGGAAALAAYLFWPTWTGTQVRALLVDLLDAHARYAGLLLAAFVDPAAYDARALAEIRSAGRLTRSNVEAAVDRMLGEPSRVQSIDRHTALGVLAALRRATLAALALHSAAEARPRDAMRWLAPLAADIPRAFRESARSLRESTSPKQPSFTPVQLPQGASITERAIFEETALLADSAATVATLLGAKAWVGTPRVVR